MAIDASGDVASTDPGQAWRVTTGVDTSLYQLNGISCPSVSLRVTVDGGGNVITSTNPDSPFSFQVQWERCDATGANCSDIPTATSQQYVPVAADVGSTIRVLELAAHANGAGVTVESTQTGIVAAPKPAAPVNTLAPRVTGTPKAAAKLSCSPGNWAGSQPITLTYQWLRSGARIPAATSSSYRTTKLDAAHAISCQVTATNAAGATTANSAPVTVAPLPPCYALAGLRLAKCQALQTEQSALAKCARIKTRSLHGRKQRAACIAQAKLASPELPAAGSRPH